MKKIDRLFAVIVEIDGNEMILARGTLSGKAAIPLICQEENINQLVRMAEDHRLQHGMEYRVVVFEQRGELVVVHPNEN